MLRLCVILVILVGVVSLGACAPAAMSLSEQDNGRTIEIRHGDQLAIVLEGSPVGGYQWDWNQTAAGDDPSLLLAGEPSFKIDWGGRGRTRFTFETQHPGRTTIMLVGHPTSTPGGFAEQTYTVDVVVR
jgi:predicted secreted protein